MAFSYFASMDYIKFLFLKLDGHSSVSYLGRDNSFFSGKVLKCSTNCRNAFIHIKAL